MENDFNKILTPSDTYLLLLFTNRSLVFIYDIIRLKSGEIIHDMNINPHLGKIYAAGEHNYIENNTEPIHYEDDVVRIINQTIMLIKIIRHR